MVNQVLLEKANKLIGHKCELKLKSKILTGLISKIEVNTKTSELRLFFIDEENKGLKILFSNIEELTEYI